MSVSRAEFLAALFDGEELEGLARRSASGTGSSVGGGACGVGASGRGRRTKLVEFRVHGTPVPKGSKDLMPNRSKKLGAKPYVMVDRQSGKLKTWTEAVSWNAASCRRRPLWDGAVIVHLFFFMPRPKRLRGDRETEFMPHVGKPDADKLKRAVYDALTGQIYTDDARVFAGREIKVYETADEPPGVWVVARQYEAGNE